MNGALERRRAPSALTIGWSARPARDQDGSTENDVVNAAILVGSSFAKCVDLNALWHECQSSESSENSGFPQTSFHSFPPDPTSSFSRIVRSPTPSFPHGWSQPSASLSYIESTGARRSSVPGGTPPAGIPDGPCVEIPASCRVPCNCPSVFREN